MKLSEAYQRFCPLIQDKCPGAICMMWIEVEHNVSGDCSLRIKVGA